MIIQVLHCPYCQGTDIIRHGTTPEGKQRYRCRACRLGRGHTFLLDYTSAGQSPEVKQQIVDMAQKVREPLTAVPVHGTYRALHGASLSCDSLGRKASGSRAKNRRRRRQGRISLTFWGTRGSIPTPGPDTIRYGGNTSCLAVRLDDSTLIIFDAGTGIRPLGNALLAQPEPVRATLCLSHMHWDHIQGLPFFAPAYVDGTQLSILGPAADPLGLENILAGQMQRPYFPISMRAMTANLNFMTLTDGSVVTLPEATIKAVLLNHPGLTLGYRLTVHGKVLVYATDHEPFGDAAASKHLVHPSCLLHLARQADVLICDAQYTPEEYPYRVGWGHSTYLDALRIARQANVKRLVLFHHHPNRTDDELDAIVAQCTAWIERQGCTFTCLAAAEGRRLCL